MAGKKKDDGPKAAVRQSLEECRGKFLKRYGVDVMSRPAVNQIAQLFRVTTGIFSLDLAIGGGIPRGRVTHIWGKKSCGKTALSQKIAGNFQRRCRYCNELLEECTCGSRTPMRVVWFDTENQFDVHWAGRWGVDVNDLYFVRGLYGEQVIDAIDALVRTGDADLIVLDSVAALTAMAVVEKSAEQSTVAKIPQLMTNGLSRWTNAMSGLELDERAHFSTILLLNQVRVQGIGSYVTHEGPPGGNAIEHYQSVELHLTRRKWIELANGLVVGQVVEAKCKKNRTAPPMRTAWYALYLGDADNGQYKAGDTDLLRQVFELAKWWNLIEGSAWNTLPSGYRCNGEAQTLAYLASVEGQVDFESLRSQIISRELAWRDGNVVAPEETMISSDDPPQTMLLEDGTEIDEATGEVLP